MGKRILNTYPTLRAEMARHGETQREVAEAMGIAYCSFNQRLSKKMEWHITHIKFLCDRYNMTFEELFKD